MGNNNPKVDSKGKKKSPSFVVTHEWFPVTTAIKA